MSLGEPRRRRSRTAVSVTVLAVFAAASPWLTPSAAPPPGADVAQGRAPSGSGRHQGPQIGRAHV